MHSHLSLIHILADALYRGDRRAIEASASRLEKYSGCPFAHFISYGLRPEDLRVFEMGPREIGDIYHECIMKLSQRLTAGEDSFQGLDAVPVAITDPDSRWMKICLLYTSVFEIKTNRKGNHGN